MFIFLLLDKKCSDTSFLSLQALVIIYTYHNHYFQWPTYQYFPHRDKLLSESFLIFSTVRYSLIDSEYITEEKERVMMTRMYYRFLLLCIQLLRVVALKLLSSSLLLE